MKNLLLLFFLLFSIVSAAQSLGRVEIEGNIKVPADADAGRITIYNKNSGKGSVSSEEGDFTIYAKLNDSLYFSALQYKDLLLVVDEQAIRSRTLHVEISEDINELAEVTVRPHDLTGNLDVDTENIKTEELNLPVMTAFSINDYDWEWRPDGQTAVTNSAMTSSAGMQYGANPLAILGGIIGRIIPPKKAKNRPPSPRNIYGLINLEREIRSRYDNAFFEDVLQIRTEEIADFIAHLNNEGFSKDLLEEERELDLIQLMVEQSKVFREL